MAIRMRDSVRARPVGEPTTPSLTLTFLVQSPTPVAVQPMVTTAWLAPLLDRVAPPDTMVTRPVVGSTRKTVSPVTAEVTLPRSTLVVTWTV